MNFVCPKCAMPLVEEGGSARCKCGHAFDRAKAGYYNLFLSSAGGTHGDNREMVEARRAFLDTGAYKPLADKVSEIIKRYISGGAILDIGCGEGYYTDIIERSLSESGTCVSVSAFDISRDAVKYAARRNKNLELAVASAYKMPVADGEFDCSVNMFSPLAKGEVLRALKRGGIFVMAIPGEEHLFGLKAAAYDKPYKNTVGDSEIEGFELVSREDIKYNLTLESQNEISSLFMMTPYAYRTGRAERERIFSLDRLETLVEFVVFTYKKL